MPPLDHHPMRPAPWTARDSEVIRWLASADAGGNWLFQALRDAEAIVFDPVAKTWSGAEYVAKQENPSTGQLIPPG